MAFILISDISQRQLHIFILFVRIHGAFIDYEHHYKEKIFKPQYPRFEAKKSCFNFVFIIVTKSEPKLCFVESQVLERYGHGH